MANAIMIIGPSGSGKSTAGRNLVPEKTFWINVQGKQLPFKSKGYTKFDTKENVKGNMFKTDDSLTISKLLNHIDQKRPEITTVVIDDGQYVAANEFMRKADQKGFDKFTSIGKNLWGMVEGVSKLERENLNVYYLWHSEEVADDTGNKTMKAKTVGKLVDNVITLEGMFTTVLYAQVIKDKEKGLQYKFKTQNEGESTAKSPMGLFDELYIDNDLAVVNEKMLEYYAS